MNQFTLTLTSTPLSLPNVKWYQFHANPIRIGPNRRKMSPNLCNRKQSTP